MFAPNVYILLLALLFASIPDTFGENDSLGCLKGIAPVGWNPWICDSVFKTIDGVIVDDLTFALATIALETIALAMISIILKS